jgi:bifunctional oligoribonuclease and PAP phosphatase NrnA
MIQDDFKKAKNLIEQSRNVLLTTHERTDGDDLGSVLAIRQELLRQNKTVTVVIKGGVPTSLRFMPGSESVREEINNTSFDLLIISGCSTRDRVKNEPIINLSVPTINIDHHPDNTKYGTVNVVDAEKSAVAELVYDMFKANYWLINAQAATCLLTGIFTDTGSFMHANTQHSTLLAASDLMSKGGRIHTIAKNTYRGKSLSALKAWSKALENSFYDAQKKIIYSVITEEDAAVLGNLQSNHFEGLVETLNKVPEAKFAMFLKQEGGIVKGSLRSEEHKGVNVSEIAHKLGGGGHKLASGFSIVGKLIKTDIGNWQVV